MYLELALIVLLVVLMYQKSNFLNNITSHPLAKIVLLSGVVAITHFYGRNAGIISGLIVILLFHNLFEGMENKEGESKSEKSDEEKDDEDVDEDDKAEVKSEDEKDEEEKDESEEDDKPVDDGEVKHNKKPLMERLAIEEGFRPKLKDEDKPINLHAESGSVEPMAMPSLF